MSVIARDAVASDHLVYAWPFPIGPDEHEVACAEDEQVVMCPAWVVGGMFGPGRHRWRTPDPMRPSTAYFVLTAPVEVSFDLATMFVLPATGEAVRVRATGSLQVRCSDPSLLIAQFVGLPFDGVNDGILRSVSRSAERMLARLLTRRVVVAGTAAVVTDPQMRGAIVEELVAYNPAAGAVFGIELVRMGHIAIAADDGTRPWSQLLANPDWSGAHRDAETARVPPAMPHAGIPVSRRHAEPTLQPIAAASEVAPARSRMMGPGDNVASGEITLPPEPRAKAATPATPSRSPSHTTVAGIGAVSATAPSPSASSSGPLVAAPPPVVVAAPPPTDHVPTPRSIPTTFPPIPDARRAKAVDVPQTEDTTLPDSPVPAGSDHGGSIIGIGMGHIGGRIIASSGEISQKVGPGARVLVPGPDGLMQSATVRQLLQGYYELEVGGSGETIWVPIAGVVPES